MELRIEDYLSSKIRQDVLLTVFPEADPDEYLKEREQKEGRESIATRYVYDFPDTTVVLARHESGGALITPDEPVDILLEVHIGSRADQDTIDSAGKIAREIADEAGIPELTPEDGYQETGLFFIRH